MPKATYFGYSSFIIEGSNVTIAIDPGNKLPSDESIIPREIWPKIDIVAITHNDPDHAGKAKEIVKSGHALLLAHEELKDELTNEISLHLIKPNQELSLLGVKFKGIPITHGTLGISLAKITSVFKKPQVAKGNVGFLIELEGRFFCHLGDTLLREDWEEWRPDILMIPIGRATTMDPAEALDAVEKIKPRVVIPIHYNLKFGVYRALTVNPQEFKNVLDERGYDCRILSEGDSIVV